MSERLLRGLALAGCFVLAVVLSWRTDASYDTGFHLATGRWILSHHAWPRLDPFTYTVSGHPYVTMHGLFQVALALAQRAGGDAGMSVLRTMLVLGTFGIAWATCVRRGVRAPAVLLSGFALAILACELRFSLRPELVSFVSLAAILHLLTRHHERHRPRWLWGVPIVQVLWVNSHALSPLGPAVTGLYAACGLADPVTRRDPWPWAAFLASCLALLANPYGIEGVAFVFGLATRLQPHNAFARSIIELSPSFAREFAGLRPVLVYKLLLAGAFGVFLLDRIAPGPAVEMPRPAGSPAGARRARTAARAGSASMGVPRVGAFDVAVVLLFAALSVRSVRNVPLFVIAALPPTLAGAQAQLLRLASGLRHRMRAGYAAMALAGFCLVVVPVEQVITGGWYIDDRRAEAFGSGPSPGVLPTRTLDYVVVHGLHGPIYNHLNFGGAVIGRLWPRERDFIDGRLEVMGEQFERQWQRIERGPGWDAMIARYDPGLLLVPNTELPVLRRVARDPRWALVEWDGAAALFLRRRGSPADSALVEAARRRRAALADPRDPFATVPAAHRQLAPWAAWFGPRHYPGESWGEANALYGIGDFSAARREYQRAIRESDRDYAPLLLGLASADEHCGRWDEALSWYDRVLELESGNAIAGDRARRIRWAGRPGS